MQTPCSLLQALCISLMSHNPNRDFPCPSQKKLHKISAVAFCAIIALEARKLERNHPGCSPAQMVNAYQS